MAVVPHLTDHTPTPCMAELWEREGGGRSVIAMEVRGREGGREGDKPSSLQVPPSVQEGSEGKEKDGGGGGGGRGGGRGACYSLVLFYNTCTVLVQVCLCLLLGCLGN